VSRWIAAAILVGALLIAGAVWASRPEPPPLGTCIVATTGTFNAHVTQDACVAAGGMWSQDG
jgi:hypothetical protein